jgi:hypothetical protein
MPLQTDYMNSVFLTNPTMAAPGQGLGAAVRGWCFEITNQL